MNITKISNPVGHTVDHIDMVSMVNFMVAMKEAEKKRKKEEKYYAKNPRVVLEGKDKEYVLPMGVGVEGIPYKVRGEEDGTITIFYR